MSKPVCKGSWSLGSACEECDRCKDTAIGHIRSLQGKLSYIQSVAQQSIPSKVELDIGGNPTGFDGGRLVVAKAVLAALGK